LQNENIIVSTKIIEYSNVSFWKYCTAVAMAIKQCYNVMLTSTPSM